MIRADGQYVQPNKPPRLAPSHAGPPTRLFRQPTRKIAHISVGDVTGAIEHVILNKPVERQSEFGRHLRQAMPHRSVDKASLFKPRESLQLFDSKLRNIPFASQVDQCRDPPDTLRAQCTLDNSRSNKIDPRPPLPSPMQHLNGLLSPHVRRSSMRQPPTSTRLHSEPSSPRSPVPPRPSTTRPRQSPRPMVCNIQRADLMSREKRQEHIKERCRQDALRRQCVRELAQERRAAKINLRAGAVTAREAHRATMLQQERTVAAQQTWLGATVHGLFAQRLLDQMLVRRREKQLRAIRGIAACKIQKKWRTHSHKMMMHDRNMCSRPTVISFCHKLLSKVRRKFMTNASQVLTMFFQELKGMGLQRLALRSFRKKLLCTQRAVKAWIRMWRCRRELLDEQWQKEEPRLLRVLELKRRKIAQKPGVPEGTKSRLDASSSIMLKLQSECKQVERMVGIQKVPVDVRQAVIAEHTAELKKRHVVALLKYQEEAKSFDTQFAIRCECELAKRLMRGDIQGGQGGITPEEFGQTYLQDELKRRPRRPLYKLALSIPELHALIHKGIKINTAAKMKLLIQGRS